MDALPSLEQLQNLSSGSALVAPAPMRNGGMRLQAVRDVALGVGMRGGMAHRSKVIDQVLADRARDLDRIYDFSGLLVHGRIIPPVLSEARDIYTQEGGDTLRLAGNLFKVEAQARFSSRPPHWRQYLALPSTEGVVPNDLFLPRDGEEREAWKRAVAEGWRIGIEQANLILASQLDRLNRDFIGMVRYHIYVKKNLITMPVMAQQNMPLNLSGDALAVDETLLRIVTLPAFNTDQTSWKALPSPTAPAQTQAE
ncbi:type IV secretory system conjugative DNA transfer family protein [Parachitinimonas caeni]|uniref:Type IV secretory system conjugative DNA transfer family protein n=1 Tax=Parachitinimonas caeni TaxID=3031301 RepID=A0ABT7DUX6_9NEIS|nr:type IV secretory system conjugative DNA transfer family protein [Parachitinimonas caeni]MDK2123866.1 type IV secretory system conjugative DNA transfer family protein [Parachitinimonas caeni]